MRRRFPESVAERLQRLEWWNWSHDRLHAALPDFQSFAVSEFLDKYEEAGAAATAPVPLLAETAAGR